MPLTDTAIRAAGVLRGHNHTHSFAQHAHAGSTNSTASTAPLDRRPRRPEPAPVSQMCVCFSCRFASWSFGGFLTRDGHVGRTSSVDRHPLQQLLVPILDQNQRRVWIALLPLAHHDEPLAIR